MRLRLAGLIASAQRSMSLRCGAREAADHRVLGALGDLVHGGEIAFRGDREAGFDDVHAHGVEQFGDLELLFVGHGRAGALLAVAQRRVEDDDAVLVGLGLGGHGIDPSRRMRRFRALYGVLIPKVPRVPRREMPSRPSGADKEKERAQNEGGRGFGLPPPARSRRCSAASTLPQNPHFEPAKIADQGKVRVNRRWKRHLLLEGTGSTQAADRSTLLPLRRIAGRKIGSPMD